MKDIKKCIGNLGFVDQIKPSITSIFKALEYNFLFEYKNPLC